MNIHAPMLTPEQLASLRSVLPADAVLTGAEACAAYGRDETERGSSDGPFFPPAAVAFPSSVEEVAAILRLASAERIPVTPRGAGTGLSGGALPVAGGIVLSLERMRRIRSIDPRNLVAEVETGVILGDLQRVVEAQGLFYPPDPASRDSCHLGGNLAEDSAGPRSCKYGTTRAWVLGLEAVLADGSVVHTGGSNRKDVAGYNLTQLLIGSEGTLAVITAATLKLTTLPAATLTMILPFPTLAAAAAVVETVCARHDPAACEILEAAAIAAVGRVLPLPAALTASEALLLIELHGDSHDRLLERASALAADAKGAGEAMVALDAAEERRLWAIRRRVGEAVKHLSAYKEADAVVPRAALVDLVDAARTVAARHGLRAICYGHAGDGNLHVNLLRGDLADDEWRRRRDRAEADLFAAVTALGGKITGEHGVGWTQRRYLPLSVDPPSMAIMRAIKTAFDPLGILNPGKVFP